MTRRSPFGSRRLLGVATLALSLGACADVLEVSNEQDILDQNLNTPEAVAPLMNGVIGDYALAYANAIDIIGLFGQELIHTGSFPTWREVETGIGTRPSATGNQVYQNASRAICRQVGHAASVNLLVLRCDCVSVWSRFHRPGMTSTT